MKITFKKPTKKLINGLKNEGYTCVDMHIHSHYSDGFNRIFTILKKCKRKKIGVAIADHNEIKGSLEASKQKDILIIPAIELTSKEGIDLLVFFYSFNDLKKFYNKEIKKNIDKKKILSRLTKSLIKILDDCNKYKCLTCLPHPFAYAYKNVSRFLKKNYNRKIISTDAIEVINGENTRKRNLNAIEWKKKFNKLMTAGSDAHIRSEIGNVVTCCKADNIKDFLDEIKKKKSIVIGKETRLTKRVISHFSSLRKRVRTARPIILKRIKDNINGNAPTETFKPKV